MRRLEFRTSKPVLRQYRLFERFPRTNRSTETRDQDSPGGYVMAQLIHGRDAFDCVIARLTQQWPRCLAVSCLQRATAG